MAQVSVSPDEFNEDAENHLGKANGNVYQRRPGVEGVHDGQIMVRLKKKRYIVVDYGFEPTDDDVAAAAQSPHVKIFDGAGKRKCTMAKCNKIGVPVCLYDSEPGETDSLYLRSGLCFTCQRNLNEKRRTERKRPPKVHDSNSTANPSIIYAIGPSQKKFKLNGSTIQLNSDAVIVNGPVDGLRPCGENYGFQDIGTDMQALARESAADVDRLVDAVSGGAATTTTTAAAAAETAAAAASGTTEEQSGGAEMSAEATASAVVEASSGLLDGGEVGVDAAASSSSISALYEKAFKSLNKTIFLLSQWKSSWDSAVETVTDPSLADAVASAAAVVAAAADGQDQGSNMVSLLLAADKRKDAPPAEGGGNANGEAAASDSQEVHEV